MCEHFPDLGRADQQIEPLPDDAPRRGSGCERAQRGRAVILGTGLDLTEVARIRRAIARHGRRFLERVFTPAEIAHVERKANRPEGYAARFAAKEAGMKAIGTGWRRGVRWRDFEVVNLPTGKPTLRLHGQAARIAEGLGGQSISLSLSHTESLGMAIVILEG